MHLKKLSLRFVKMHHAKNSYLKMLEHSQHNSKVYQHLGWLAMNMKPHSENAIAIEYLKKAVAEGLYNTYFCGPVLRV